MACLSSSTDLDVAIVTWILSSLGPLMLMVISLDELALESAMVAYGRQENVGVRSARPLQLAAHYLSSSSTISSQNQILKFTLCCSSRVFVNLNTVPVITHLSALKARHCSSISQYTPLPLEATNNCK